MKRLVTPDCVLSRAIIDELIRSDSLNTKVSYRRLGELRHTVITGCPLIALVGVYMRPFTPVYLSTG